MTSVPSTPGLARSGAGSSTAGTPAGGSGLLIRRAGMFLSTILLLLTAMALVAVVVAAANGLRIRVEQTGSMAPALRPGDLVIVRQTPIEAVRVGDVIGVRTSMGQVIVHRVKRLAGVAGALQVTTQGDANPTSEQWTIRNGSQVALVRGSVPAVGSAVDAVKGPFAAFAVLIAGLLLALAQLRSIWTRPS